MDSSFKLPAKLFCKLAVFFSSLLVTFFCLLVSSLDSEVSFACWVLPLIYTIFLFFYLPLFRKTTPGIVILNIVLYAKYIIVPFCIYASGDASLYINNSFYMNEAIAMMVYEGFIVFIFIYITEFISRDTPDAHFTKGDNRWIVALVIVFSLFFIALKYPYFIGGLDLLTHGFLTQTYDAPSFGLVSIVWQAFSAWLFLFICHWLYALHISFFGFKINSMFLIIGVSFVYLLLTFVGQASISRWYTMISFVAVISFLIKMYPLDYKKILIIVCIPVLVSFLTVSVYKNSNILIDDNVDIADAANDLIDITTLDTYLSGPYSVNNSIGLCVDNNIDSDIIVKDIVSQIPMVNHWFDCHPNSPDFYNMYVGRWFNGEGDQIIPLVGQSYVYFGICGLPLLSTISVLLVRFFDYRYSNSSSIMAYLYAFVSSWCAVMMILNLTIFTSWIFMRILPLYLLIKCVDIFKFKN